MRWWWMMLWLAACGGTPAEDKPKTADDAAPTGPSPGQKCIADAQPPSIGDEDGPSRVSVKHLVIKHAEADRAGDDVTRTREEACLRALEALEKLKAGTDFANVVEEYSDEAGAKSTGGIVSQFKRDDVAPGFAAAAFALEIDQVSHVVETKSGFHLMMRTE